MSEEKISATGERAAIGGYLPQFDEFARFVYIYLINKELEWIRIADPKAEKLDDIQYSTHSEIHAYQVKWTIAEAKITYLNFTALIPLIVASWKSIKAANPDKKIIPHLLTNKALSIHDSLKNGEDEIGSFNDFFSDVWIKIKSNQTIDTKWKFIIEELKRLSKLSDAEFDEFVKCFDFQPDYKQKKFSISNIKHSKEEEDLIQLRDFIIEKVASPERLVEFSNQQIIKALGWIDRFKTTFNHELIVDQKRYQPIQSTIDLLNNKLSENENGYFFLLGGPGSGKSTLLNQWSKGIKSRIVRYYAFDFVNPSSNFNFYERGNATNLFYDLVFQLKDAGIYKRDILPYKDIIFLKEVFNEQLKAIGKDYESNGQKTLIIIDGLDHVPREYKSTANSFLRELPLPSSLPKGVFIILGSQSYGLEDIPQEIKTEFKNGNRTIPIDSLSKEEVYKYIDNLEGSKPLNSSQKLLIFEKSQGHPLYLSYLIEKINQSDDIDTLINSFIPIDGDIDNYYKKIWEPIQQEEHLINLLGLVARINGLINLKFVQEWNIERSIQKAFKEKAMFLFNSAEKSLSFFHNSFKQFLLYHTSLNYLTTDEEYDPQTDLNYHSQLAHFYKNSTIEPSWKQNYHLFQSKKYDEFIAEVTPNSFTAQLLNYRPVEEIKQDAKRGIEIAKQTKNINILIRYLFSLAEIEKRLSNIDPAGFTEELLILEKADLARDYLRTGNSLLCSEEYAFKASRLFIEFGHNTEGEIFFNLAYPEFINHSEIKVDATQSNRYEDIKRTLQEWIYVAPYFVETVKIFSKIDHITFDDYTKENQFNEKEADLFLDLLVNLGCGLISQNKWEGFDQVIQKLNIETKKDENSFFQLVEYAIQECLDLEDNNRANAYLALLISYFTKEKTSPIRKIYIADLIYKVTKNIDETFDWIKDIKQPSNVGKNQLDYKDSLEPFYPLIKLNKLLNICGKGVSIIKAIPKVSKNSEEEMMVDFERMLCLVTQILTDGILQNIITTNIITRVIPIIRFYYKDIPFGNSYWHKITQSKGQYFDYLITAVSQVNAQSLESLGDYLLNEFDNNPKYWDSNVQRKVIKSLLENGFDIDKTKKRLIIIEKSMRDGHDINGRITECLAHARIWFYIRELEEGEKWLKQSIQESIGVGYRKDYQFNTWIRWLKRINLIQSSNAPSNIKWFLSHLNHIKESTEGPAYRDASESLLAVTLEWNLYAGFKQLLWQLDEGLINFADSMSLFIEYYVLRVKTEDEFKSIVQLYCQLYLLLSESSDSALLTKILSKGYELLQQNFLKDYLGEIIDEIKIKSFEGNRLILLSEIDEFGTSLNISITDYYDDFKIPIKKAENKSSSYSNNLVLKDNHLTLSENEIFERVRNFEDFKKIIQEEDTANSYFSWSNIIDKITPLLSVDEIIEISSLDNLGKRKSDFYAKLSKSALELGDRELALMLANKSIELSSEMGWDKHWDGGSRINGFKSLREIDVQFSSKKAFDVFAQDIISGDNPDYYIRCLEDIVPLLTENFDEEVLWTEIFDYLQRLMSNSIPIEDLPEIESIDKPILEILTDYIKYLTNSPVLFIKEISTLLLAKFINQNNVYALNQLIDEHVDDYKAMDIMKYLLELKSKKLNDLKSTSQKLALSKDYQLREYAKEILIYLGVEIPKPNLVTLPAVYSLEISNSIKLKKETKSHFSEVDINDPVELLRPFGFLIDGISNESGISKSNLIHRIYFIMKKIGNAEEWTYDYTNKLKTKIEAINLKYSCTNLLAISARRAIMHVVAELIDSGNMDNLFIREFFRTYDYSVSLFSEISKPSFVPKITASEFGTVEQDWRKTIYESPRLKDSIFDYNNNMKVIGEYNQINNLDWGMPSEEYMSQLSIYDEIKEEYNYIFGSAFNQLSSDYYDLHIKGFDIVLIRNHIFNQFNLKSKWIAINPTLAKLLGWKPETMKLFAWKDSDDQLMAESIYWSNGNIEMLPRKVGETGEGWFVLVSNKGLEQIKEVISDLYLHQKLIRSKYEKSEFKQSETFSVVKLED